MGTMSTSLFGTGAAGMALTVHMHSGPTALLSVATNDEKRRVSNGYDLGVLKMVAEEGLEPPTRGL